MTSYVNGGKVVISMNIHKLKRAGVALFVSATSLMLTVAVAFAQAVTPDPSGGAYTQSVEDSQSWITDVGAGPLFALAATVTLIIVGLRWVKKSRQVAT